MLYRRLGNTGLRLSAIGLGGHWRTADGGRYCDRFSGDEVPADVVRNRADVLAACRDQGINYLDITTRAECQAYGLALGRSRDAFLVGADDYRWSGRNRACLTVPSLTASVERCLGWLRTDRLDLWRVIAEVGGQNTDAEVETVLEAGDHLRRAGKIRVLGMSSHHPGWIRRLVERYPGIQVALVPCLPGSRYDAGILSDVAARQIGLLTIKPFAGGWLFRDCDGTADRSLLARHCLKSMLEAHPGITSILPGLNSPQEVLNAAAAATPPAMTPAQTCRLEQAVACRLAALPEDYHWLAAWFRNGSADCRGLVQADKREEVPL